MDSKIYEAHIKRSNEFILKIFWALTFIQFPFGFLLSMFKLFYVGPMRFLGLAAFLAVFNLILTKFMKGKVSNDKTPYQLMCVVMLLCAVIIFSYINDIAMQFLWLFPVIISIIYFDRRLTIFATIGSLIGLILTDIIQPIQPHPDRFIDLFLTTIIIILGVIATFYFLAVRIQNLFNLLLETDRKLNISYQKLGHSYNKARILSEDLTKAVASLAATTEYVNHSVSELATQSSSVFVSIERVVDETKHADDLVKKMIANFNANISQARLVSTNHLLATEKIHKTLQNIAESLNHTERINQSLDIIIEMIENLKRRCYEINKILDFVYFLADQSQNAEPPIDSSTAIADESLRSRWEKFEQSAVKSKEFSRTAQKIVEASEKDVQSVFDEVSAIKLIIENEIRIALDIRKQLGITQLIIDRNKRHIETLDGQFDDQRKAVAEMPRWIDLINKSIKDVAGLIEINAGFSEETSASMQDLSVNAKSISSSADILRSIYQNDDDDEGTTLAQAAATEQAP
jgi:methyl-accepting chemotaxis protein